MKKFSLAILVSFSLISCSISEQILFNEDGSGKLTYSVDMSKMIALSKDLDKSNEMTKELTEDTEKDMDTVFDIKDVLAKRVLDGKPLTPEQIKNMESMKNYTFRMYVNKAKSEMKYTMTTDFKSIAEVGNVGSALSSMKSLSGKKANALDAATPQGNTEVVFLFDGKRFSRSVVEKPYTEEEEIIYEEVSDTAVYEHEMDTLRAEDYEEEDVEMETDENEVEEKMSKEDIEKMNKEFAKIGEMMKKGMEESGFEFQYTFAKKIKKVSLSKSNYKLSEDKKTIFLKYNFETFSKKIKDLNLNIEFE
ncbi:hypothetical protein [Flavobacterium difficile]|uniref:Lipoprotein n=1 Tax=Flavobacterium difficile TaxID=2709659 RepID=A0ABX0I0Z2_9FLAO|nr:hypothetical protein [Flavobacterium difficile]NHM00863.1 hypothetical protein [Flavobacterium difficile]